MANKSGGPSKVAQANSYKTTKRWETNRLKKLMRALKAHPNNLQIEQAMKAVHYRRKTPKTTEWSSSQIYIAGLFKQFVGKVDRDIFSTNEKTAAAALLLKGPHSSFKYEPVTEKTMFKLGTRVRFTG